MSDCSDSDVQIIGYKPPRRKRKRESNPMNPISNQTVSESRSSKRGRFIRDSDDNTDSEQDYGIQDDRNQGKDIEIAVPSDAVDSLPLPLPNTNTNTNSNSNSTSSHSPSSDACIENVYAESIDDSNTSMAVHDSDDVDMWPPLEIEPERRMGVQRALRALSNRILAESDSLLSITSNSMHYDHGDDVHFEDNVEDDYVSQLSANRINRASMKSVKSEQEEEVMRLQDQLRNIRDQLDDEKRENRKLRKQRMNHLLRMKGMKEKIINGRDPLYSSVSMHSVSSNSKCAKYSEKCYQLRRRIMHSKASCALDIVDENEARTPRQRSMLKRVIMEYLRENANHQKIEHDEESHANDALSALSGLDVSAPKLCVGGLVIECDRVLEEFVIGTPHRIPALIGQRGLRAKRDIPRNTCVGQYVGVTYLKEEFDAIYDGSSQYHLRNTYAFNQVVKVPDDHNEEKEVEEGKTKEVYLVLDGYATTQMVGESGHLSRINDCRKDIHRETMSDEDRKMENVEIVQSTVNQWPVIFMVTNKDISKGSELFGWFGTDFGSSIKSMDENTLLRHEIRMCLNDQELKDEREQMVKDLHSIYDSE